MKRSSTNQTGRFLIIAIAGMLMLPACEEDDKTLPPVIQFIVNLQKVTEGDEVVILLGLDNPAPYHGSVELTIQTNAIYNEHYMTSPSPSNNSIVLNFHKGHTSTALKIITIDNTKYEGAMFMIFQLNVPSGGVRLGEATTMTLTISDDEAPSMASFEGNETVLSEKDEAGLVVQIPLSEPAKGEGSVTVSLNPGQAQQEANFTIDQELAHNSFKLNVFKNVTHVSFKVFPIDNDLFTGNFILSFSITEISGVVQKGNTLDYSLTLIDDESPSIARFALPSGTVAENNGDGIGVEILLSSPVKGEGTIGISLPAGTAVYGTDFTTLPEVKDNTITLDLVHDQTGAGFTVIPLNDDLFTDNLIQSFSISEVRGVVWKGSNDQNFQLTILDDD
ncbi:MAG: hypothetical protein WD824_14965 [Cyclobacteriaceae bacterium]